MDRQQTTAPGVKASPRTAPGIKASPAVASRVPPAVPAPLPSDARHRTASLLHTAALRLLRRAAAADRVMDLDGPRASLLSVLVFGGPQTMSQLAERERVTPPAITKLVTALEAAGLALRRPWPDDRRVVLVEATEAGRELLERGRADRVRAVAGLLAGLPPDDLATLERAARIVTGRLVGIPAQPTGPADTDPTGSAR